MRNMAVLAVVPLPAKKKLMTSSAISVSSSWRPIEESVSSSSWFMIGVRSDFSNSRLDRTASTVHCYFIS
jgi:hypothetical protein